MRAILLVTMAVLLTGCGGPSSVFESLSDPSALSIGAIGLLLTLGTFISEDISCVTAGVIAAQGLAPFFVVTFACFAGIWISDLGLFALGRLSGTRWRSIPPFRWLISEKRIEAGKCLFDRHGSTFIFTSRFLPGSRVPVYMAAGMLGYPFLRFAGWMAVACLIWTPLLVGLAMVTGEALLDWLERYERFTWFVIPLTIVLLWTLSHFIISLLSYRGRRLALSRWHRFAEWEFWPMWRFYPPVAFYILWLGLKHRSLTVFTLANPFIPLGGLAFESKSEILNAIMASPDGAMRVARYRPIDSGEPRKRLSSLDTFLESEGLTFPVVLKPDIGERGQGVAVIRSREGALTFLTECQHKVIAQEFISGPEYGVFYYRYPGEKTGHLLSITEKRLPSLTGDGERTLEELILADPRALRMAPFFLKKWDDCLLEVPSYGNRFQLTDLGTHCRGAIFLNGQELLTEPLRMTFDSLSREIEGFYFGRYDVRVPNPKELVDGEGWKVLELNGVSAESTHIYQPGYSLLRAYRDLFRQWRIAFEIGDEIRRQGKSPPSLVEVWRTIRSHANHNWYETSSVK